MGWDIWDKLPAIGSLKHLYASGKAVGNGDWKGAGKEFARSADPIINDALGYQDGQDEKRHGYDVVQDEAERLKAEAIARKDKMYAMGEEKFEPTKAAMSAIYGDPKTWKL